MVTQLKSIHVAGDAENASFAEAVEQLTCLVEAGEHERAVALIDEIPEYADKLRRILPARASSEMNGFEAVADEAA